MTSSTDTSDPKVSSLVSRHIASAEPDPDALFAELEAEDDTAFRAQRAQQLSSELARLRPNATVQQGADVYTTLKSDEEVLRFTTDAEKCILHFLHPDFARCAKMDLHLQKIAERHASYGGGHTKLGRVNVGDCPFVVEKLGIQVLPCVIGYIHGVAKGRIVGFEGVTSGGNEQGVKVTRTIEATAVEWKVLPRRLLIEIDDDTSESEPESKPRKNGRRGIRDAKKEVDGEDDDWD